MIRHLRSFWLTLACSIVLGGVFIYSSYHKIADPPDFAKIVFNYKLVPAALINLVAIYMPWFELLAGAALVTGLLRRGGALGITLLCLLFIAALSYNLYRGHPTICGCFNTYAEGVTWTIEEKFAKMRFEIFLDVGLLLLGAQVLHGTASRKEPAA